MEANALATVAAVIVVVTGLGALFYALRQSGDTLTDDDDAVDRAIEAIDPVRLSNLLSKK